MSTDSRFGEGHIGNPAETFRRSLKRTRGRGRGSNDRKRDPLASGYRRVFSNAEIAAQHGPVKVLVKDGKPVEESTNA